MNPKFVPGTIHPEEDYLEIERLGVKLGIPVPMLHIKVEAINPDGSPGQVYKDRSRTYNRNFWNIIFCNASQAPAGAATFGAGFLAVKTTGAAIKNSSFDLVLGALSPVGVQGFGSTAATAGVDTSGIVVGTGVIAESFEHITLNTQTLNGVTAGKISYANQSVTAVSYDAGTKTWTATLVRIFNNNSGGTITIAEVGIYGSLYIVNNNNSLMFCRDLLGASVAVLNGGQLTVTYTMTLTFPA
jgi:hypothetical protein